MNKCVLSYEVDNFRAYSGVTKGGGGTTVSSASGGSESLTSASGGSESLTSASGGDSIQVSAIDYIPGSYLQGLGTSNNGDGHTHSVTDEAGTYTTSSASSSHVHSVDDHEHSVSIPSHTHGVTVPSHTHGVNIPSHTHSVTIPDHTHDIDHGIYEFGYLPPSVVVKVDGNVVPGVTSLSGSDIDIVPYLSKTGTKVNRSQFHTVEVIPNTDTNNPKGLARIYANVVKQVFIKSIGGGDY